MSSHKQNEQSIAEERIRLETLKVKAQEQQSFWMTTTIVSVAISVIGSGL